MDVRYDRANDLFWVNGKQVYWSSVYVLRQKKSGFKKLCRSLKVSKEEQPLFIEELDDLRKLGFIRGKEKISVTKKGKEFLHAIEKKIKFRHLRERGIEDIDDVFEEAEKIDHLRLSKTKLLVPTLPDHYERVDWFALFVNSAVGYFFVLVVALLVWFGMGALGGDALIVQLAMSPIASVMTIGFATVFLWIFYQGGKAIEGFAFRHK
ncbi:MAG: hypothetical protein KAW41_06805 [Candidatus Diapherotrites archaeon]|nr:hypothetical protein [Candidatus Diapherotrites archaeon]